MFKLLKQKFCNHTYFLLTSYKKDVDKDELGYDLQEVFVMYCPNCSHQIEVLKHEYTAITERQRVDREYNK